MIKYTTGDILNADVEALVNTVNCVGVMGRGVALQFKKAFPLNFKAYEVACERQEVQPGHMFVFETGNLMNPRFIINFPTKRHWRGKSRLKDIDSGIVSLLKEIRERNIRSIAIPPLGSGLGGLYWPDVRSRIEEAMSSLTDVDVIVYEPSGAPSAEKMVRNIEVPKMTPGRAALVALMDRYLRGLLDPFITLLEVHKLMYFMQESGEPLKLIYEKEHYGPYATNLRHVLNQVEGHLILGYRDGNDAPTKELDLVQGASQTAENFLKKKPETRQRFDRVIDLVSGFESSFGLELLATVHWIAKNENPSSVDDVITKTHAWNNHKKQFTERQIEIASKVLSDKGWISLN